MPYGPRYGRMEQPMTEEEAAAERRKQRKLELVSDAIQNKDLSWTVKTRHSLEFWRVLTYDLQWRDGMPGALIIVDRDTDMDVKIYAPGMWFDVDTVLLTAQDGEEAEYQNWKPQAAYLSDLADRLMDEELPE